MTLMATGIVEYFSDITCPACGYCEIEEMSVDACAFFYDCPRYGTRLKSKPGDCCVFCSYGSVKCPPVRVTGGRVG